MSLYIKTTRDEMCEVINEFYHLGGSAACKEHSTGWKVQQINHLAYILKVKVDKNILGQLRTKTNPWEVAGYDTYIFDLYEDGGAEACAPFMPDKTKEQITGRAHQLGVKMNKQAFCNLRKEKLNEALDKRLDRIRAKKPIRYDSFITAPAPPSIIAQGNKYYYRHLI